MSIGADGIRTLPTQVVFIDSPRITWYDSPQSKHNGDDGNEYAETHIAASWGWCKPNMMPLPKILPEPKAESRGDP